MNIRGGVQRCGAHEAQAHVSQLALRSREAGIELVDERKAPHSDMRTPPHSDMKIPPHSDMRTSPHSDMRTPPHSDMRTPPVAQSVSHQTSGRTDPLLKRGKYISRTHTVTETSGRRKFSTGYAPYGQPSSNLAHDGTI